MDHVVAGILALLHWRLLLSVATGIAASFLLSNAIAWFGSGASIALVLVAFAFGLLWQGRAEAGVGLFERVPEPPISRPVAAMGLAMIGFIWGGWLAVWTGSSIASAAILVGLCVLVVTILAATQRRPVGLSRLVFSTSCLLAGFAGLLALQAWAI